tara:strand:+ start:310 stop:522 length:213 start_codon:yes stop_codon:yes gene_type:complete
MRIKSFSQLFALFVFVGLLALVLGGGDQMLAHNSTNFKCNICKAPALCSHRNQWWCARCWLKFFRRKKAA